MTPHAKRALTIAAALAALTVMLWFAIELSVISSATILVVKKNAFSSQDMTSRYVVTDNNMTFGVGIDTIGSEDRNTLWAKLETGCNYDVRYLDQGRYPYSRAKDMSGMFIANATKLDCPGLPQEPVRPMPSAQELLDKIIGGQKAPVPRARRAPDNNCQHKPLPGSGRTSTAC